MSSTAPREQPLRLKNIDPSNMTREQLLHRVTQLEKHVTNLRNVIAKTEHEGGQSKATKRQKAGRHFDFNRYHTRHVAFKVAYLGWGYHGYATQEDTMKTIEHELFSALTRTRLIQSRETAEYHRCGRTDKGVSAFSQVISLDVRTNLSEGRGVRLRDGLEVSAGQGQSEIQYCVMLNRLLPADIRVLAWAAVDTDFSARFSCRRRTYKYFFPKASLDIDAMNSAAGRLVGSHDFRNLCKMDVCNGVVSYIRRLMAADVSYVRERGPVVPSDLCVLRIVGNAFLWHQIRCIVALLFMIGEGHEKVEIIDELLDIERHPRKPQYAMASELPLVLFSCQFDDVEWITDKDCQLQNLRMLQELSTEHSIKAAMVQSLLTETENSLVTDDDGTKRSWKDLHLPVISQLLLLNCDSRARDHRPLMERPKCESLEQRVAHFAKRRRITGQEVAGSQVVGSLDEARQASDLDAPMRDALAPCPQTANLAACPQTEDQDMSPHTDVTSTPATQGHPGSTEDHQGLTQGHPGSTEGHQGSSDGQQGSEQTSDFTMKNVVMETKTDEDSNS